MRSAARLAETDAAAGCGLGLPQRLATAGRRPQTESLIRVLLAALLMFFLVLGGNEGGRLLWEIRAVAALAGALLVAAYVWQLTRAHDWTDRLTLAALLLFLITCVTSSAPRSSFDAATTALAYAAAFYVARGAVATERGRQLAIEVLGAAGIALGLGFSLLWGWVWVQWLNIPGAGPPPLDLELPALHYGHQYPVAMLAGVLLPGPLLVMRRKWLWPFASLGAAGCISVAVMSGGRGIWFGLLVGIPAAFIAGRSGRMPQREWFRRALIACTLILIALVLAGPILTRLASRLAATSTIELRAAMWQLSLGHWLQSPITGHGPGNFAAEFAETGYYHSFVGNVPHAHNLVVQTLFEGGLLGVGAVVFVCLAVAVGIRSGRNAWPFAGAVGFFAGTSITDNPAVVPTVVGVLIVWAALATPRIDKGDRRAPGRARLFALPAGALIAAAVGSSLVASAAFDGARDRAAAGAPADVIRELRTAVRFDPAFALYHRELGVWLHDGGQAAEAASELTFAIALNPSDLQAYRALALVELDSGSPDQAAASISRALALSSLNIENLLTSAYVQFQTGDPEAGRAALVEALRRAPWLPASSDWATHFPVVSHAMAKDALSSWTPGTATFRRRVQQRTWLAAMVGARPPSDATPELRAQAAVIACHHQEAADILAELSPASASQPRALQASLMLANSSGGQLSDRLGALVRLRDPTWLNAEAVLHAVSPASNEFYDNRYYDRLAMPSTPGIKMPTAGSGLRVWLQRPTEAARQAAIFSPLARCNP